MSLEDDAPPGNAAPGKSPREEVSSILQRIGDGAESPGALMPLIHGELRAMAGRMMRGERGDHTLQPTALVHEVFVRLVERQAGLGRGRSEFLAVAAKAMRNLLVDHARRARAEKRGGGADRISLSGLGPAGSARGDEFSRDDLLDLDRALDELASLDERQAKVVEMCYFAGMSGQEIAEQLGVHRNSVVRDLQMARAWLRHRLRDRRDPPAAD